MTDNLCKTCDNGGWVCENHLDRPWDGTSSRDDACGCGAGAPCGSCCLEMASAGYVELARQYAREQALEEAAVTAADEAGAYTTDGEGDDWIALRIADAIRALKENTDAG